MNFQQTANVLIEDIHRVDGYQFELLMIAVNLRPMKLNEHPNNDNLKFIIRIICVSVCDFIALKGIFNSEPYPFSFNH